MTRAGLPVLLAVGLGWGVAGCGDDDEEEAGGTVVTNIVNGIPVVVTNAPADGNNPAGEVPGDGANTGLAAPQLVAPANMALVDLFKQGGTTPVDFRWTPVAGAASYVFELNGTVVASAITPDATHRRDLPMGEYEWRVWARNAAGAAGPASGKNRFGVMPANFLAAPVVLEPDDGTVRDLFKQGGAVTVYFEWIFVPGADYHVVEINGAQTQVRMGESVLIRDLGVGVYRWRVWGVDPQGRKGPAIGTRILTMRLAAFKPDALFSRASRWMNHIRPGMRGASALGFAVQNGGLGQVFRPAEFPKGRARWLSAPGFGLNGSRFWWECAPSQQRRPGVSGRVGLAFCGSGGYPDSGQSFKRGGIPCAQ